MTIRKVGRPWSRCPCPVLRSSPSPSSVPSALHSPQGLNTRGVADSLAAFGFLVAHDICESVRGNASQTIAAPAPTCDTRHDPQCWGNVTYPVEGDVSTVTPLNRVTAFLDAGPVYGNSIEHRHAYLLLLFCDAGAQGVVAARCASLLVCNAVNLSPLNKCALLAATRCGRSTAGASI